MFKWLKKVFIPHKHNDYKPHLFREVGAILLFSVIIFLFLLAVSGPTVLNRLNLTALVLPKVLVDYTNDNRATENFSHLTINSTLEKAAQLKANDMAEKGYFAHKNPEGKSPWYFFGQAGYDFAYAGENLAVNFSDSVDVSRAWMASPGHRANIMNGNFTEIGIATAEGMYQGRPTVFVVQLFGRPAAKKQVATSPLVSSTPKPKPTTSANNLTQSTPSTAVSGSPASRSTTTTQTVLAESVAGEITKDNGSSELFISVENVGVESQPTTPDPHYASLIEKIIMSPNKTLSIVYLVLALIIVTGLTLMIFIEIRTQHPRLILMGFALLFIIGGLLYIYEYLLLAPVVVV